jgi:F-type H+-transporting ATPase subunit delta
MSAGAVAERYAQALFELGNESGELALLTEKLGDFVSSFESNSQFRGILSNPTVSAQERRAVITEVARRLSVPDLGVKGLLVLAERGRLVALGSIIRRLSELADEKNGILRARVTTASVMPESYFQDLSSKIEETTGKKVVFERIVDEALVGGTITQVGDQVIDGSVRGRLDRIERELLSAVISGAN